MRSDLFVQPLRSQPWEPEDCLKVSTCKVCGEVWHPWIGSYLPCHLKCWITEAGWEFIEAHNHMSNKDLAAELGMKRHTTLIQSMRRVLDRRMGRR